MDVENVGVAFNAFMREFTAKNMKFAEKKILKSIAKQVQIVESLHKIHVFIKERYLRAGKGIDESFAAFYTQYSSRHEKPSSKIAISKLLEEDLGLKSYQKWYGN